MVELLSPFKKKKTIWLQFDAIFLRRAFQCCVSEPCLPLQSMNLFSLRKSPTYSLYHMSFALPYASSSTPCVISISSKKNLQEGICICSRLMLHLKVAYACIDL
uniref:R2R3-MYB transcription factor MYB10.1 protein n=1 Tax=Rhizophora mucronata TaxID=61149 RepID=A0A2P2JIB0_RHIMU